MAVYVKFFPLLAKRAASKQENLTVPYTEGMRPLDIIHAEGFGDIDAEAIMVLVNNSQAELDQPIHDDDRLEFMIAIAGGT